MKQPLLYVALGLFLGLGALFWGLRGFGNDYFCEAASDAASYRGEWFYRLHAAPDGWLLRDDDLETEFALDPQTLASLQRLNEALTSQGVTLVIAAQPPRGVALSAESVPEYRPADALASYRAAREALQNAGLVVTDLAAVVGNTPGYFFRRDHHWTPDGARSSAEAVAAAIAGTPTFASTSFVAQTFRTEADEDEAQRGSFGEAIGRICGRTPPAETFTRYRTVAETPGGGNLFETLTPPVALVGTSNSARSDLNFAGFLAHSSGLEVLNASLIGGGPEAAMAAYLRSPTFREARPVFLVWEFATLFDVPQDPLFYRQLVPSVRGACSADGSTASVTRVLGETVPLFERVRGDTGFLVLNVSDLSQTAFDVQLRYANGRRETVRLERPTRERNDGRFFLELSGQLQAATLTMPGSAEGEVEARICP